MPVCACTSCFGQPQRRRIRHCVLAARVTHEVINLRCPRNLSALSGHSASCGLAARHAASAFQVNRNVDVEQIGTGTVRPDQFNRHCRRLLHLSHAEVLELPRTARTSCSRQRLFVARLLGLIFYKRWSNPDETIVAGPGSVGGVRRHCRLGPNGQDLTGTYRCIQMCRNGMLDAPTFVTQNGDAVNLTTETGES